MKMEMFIPLLFVVVAGIYIFFKLFKDRNVAGELKKWAKQNNLNYQKKVRLGIIRFENVSVKNLIWGEYKDKRIYIFEVKNSNSSRQFSQTYFYFNGEFYSKISPEAIEQLLINKNYSGRVFGVFGRETEIETVQVLVAQIYLQFGNRVEYKTVKDIFRLLMKFYNSKTNMGDKIKGFFSGLVRADVKYNSPEAIFFVLEKRRDIERKIIEDVANAYETLLGIYNKK